MEANSTGDQGSRRAVAPNDDDDDDQQLGRCDQSAIYACCVIM